MISLSPQRLSAVLSAMARRAKAEASAGAAGEGPGDGNNNSMGVEKTMLDKLRIS